MPSASASLLQLADARFPQGGHAHSGGAEEAVAAGRVRDLPTLEGFLRGRLWTVGRTDAALGAAACDEARRPDPAWARLDAEAAARSPSPAVRRAARALGRSLLRAAGTAWPGPWVAALRAAVAPAPFASVVLGAAAAACGADPAVAALVAAHSAVAAPAAAAVRLLGLDPLEVAAAQARLAPEIDAVAAEAAATAAACGRAWSRLPASSAPLLDLGAEQHAAWEVRLFAS
jgi:urease accessory protein